MSTHAMLIQSLKHKAALFKISIMLIATSSLAGCFATDCGLDVGGEFIPCPSVNVGSSVPVIYNLPVSDGEYVGLPALQFSVSFPNGIPLKSKTEIKLNGADITADFNDWGTGVADTARVTLAINATNTPAIDSVLRDGRNSFQVTKPAKTPIFFTVDIPGAEVHFTNIDDGWTGQTFKIDRSCGGVCTSEVNGVNVANRVYKSKRGYMDVTGYIDGDGYSNITQMCVHTYTINPAANPKQSALNASKGANFNSNEGYSMCDSPANGQVTQTSAQANPNKPGSPYFLRFGSNNGENYDFSFRVRDSGNNDSNYAQNEVDVIKITVTDDWGTHETSWLRSNVPLWDSRLGNQGGLSLSFDHIAMLSTGIGVTDLLHGQVIAGFGLPDMDVGSGFNIRELYIGNDSTVNLTLPNQNNQNQGRININANIEMRVRVTTPVLCFGDITSGTQNAFVPYSANLDIRIDKSVRPYITQTTLADSSVNLDALGGGLCGGFLGIFIGLINDTVATIVQNTVGGVMANDIPTMRAKIFIEVPDVGSSKDFGPYYMPIQPEISTVYGIPKGGTGGGVNNIKWGLLLGLHPRGSNAEYNPDPGQRNVAMGLKWYGVPAATQKASLANDNVNANEGVPALSTTLGATLTEDFINAILLGLWESGLVYFDFAFSMPPVVAGNAALDNLRFTLASQQPWEIDLYPDGTASGDAQLYFPDVVVEVLGDAMLPTPKTDYNIATLLADVYFNISLDASPDKKSLRIAVADIVQVDVKEVSSDWDNTSEAQLIYVLDEVFRTLSADFHLDIPFPEILSSEVEIKAVNNDTVALYAPIDIYNLSVYPNGPDNPMFAVSSVTTIGSGVTMPNGWRNLFNNIDDRTNLITSAGSTSSPGLIPFHIYANRDYTWDEINCDQWGNNCTNVNYRWTETFEWGFRVNFNGTYKLNGIWLDRRNDCCQTRAEDITVTFNGGNARSTNGFPAGNGKIYIDIPDGTNVSYIEFRVKADSSESDTYPNSRYDTNQGNPGNADHIINITEIDFDFTPL